jgi:hypothetical protein
LEKIKAYRQTDKGKETHKKGVEKYNKNNPDKYKAHHAITNKMRYGKFPKASSQVCAVCNVSQAKEWHHYNGYDEAHWFDVIALCEGCHKSIHHPA